MEALKVGDVVRIQMGARKVSFKTPLLHSRRMGYISGHAGGNHVEGASTDRWIVGFGVSQERSRVYMASEIIPMKKGDLVQVLHAGTGEWGTYAFDGVIDKGTIRPVIQLIEQCLSGAAISLLFNSWWSDLRLLEPGDLQPHPAASKAVLSKPAPVVILDPPYGNSAIKPQVDAHGRLLASLEELAMMLFVTEPHVLDYALKRSEGALPLSEKWVTTVKTMWSRDENGWRKAAEQRAAQMNGVRGELKK